MRRRRSSRREASSIWRDLFPVKRERFLAWIEFLRYRKTLGAKANYTPGMWYTEGMPRAGGPIERDAWQVYTEWLQSMQSKRGGEGQLSGRLLYKAARRFVWAGLPAPQVERSLTHRQRMRAKQRT